MWYLLLALLLTACGQSGQEAHTFSVDPDLAPYFVSFAKNIGHNTENIAASFQSLQLPMVGQCILYSDGTKAIQIDRTYWNSIGDDQKEQLMWHELGHCSMGLQHTPGFISSGPMVGCPVSIMNPDVFSYLIDCYTNNKAYYYQEIQSHG